MNPDDLARILDELGKRLGPAGSHVFDLAVRQAMIDGYVKLIVFTILLVLTVIITTAVGVALRNHSRKNPEGTNDHISTALSLTLYLSSWLIGVALLAFPWAGMLSNLLNPEYAALRELLRSLKQ